MTTHYVAFQNLAETTGQDRANAQIVLLLQLLGLGIFLIELYLYSTLLTLERLGPQNDIKCWGGVNNTPL